MMICVVWTMVSMMWIAFNAVNKFSNQSRREGRKPVRLRMKRSPSVETKRRSRDARRLRKEVPSVRGKRRAEAARLRMTDPSVH